MHLNLTVNGQLLAKVPVDPKKCKDSQYIETMCGILAIKYQSAIDALHDNPTYYIEVPSRMARRRQMRA
jgi:hypothetical protein